MKKITKNFIFLLMFSFLLTGCSNNETNTEDLKEKVIQELDYLDTKIINIANKLNNITLQNYTITSEEISLGENSATETESSENSSSQSGESTSGENQSSSTQKNQNESENNTITTMQLEASTVLDTDENNIDWSLIKSEIEIISDSWGVVILDLSNLNVDSNEILDFSSTLDDCILSIKDENKLDTLTNIAKLYESIVKFEQAISADSGTQNIKQTKSYLLNAYSLVEEEDWTSISSNITNCESTFKNLTNDIEFIKNKEYKVNRTYILIKELQNSLTYKDKKLFYVKYKSLMESINTL